MSNKKGSATLAIVTMMFLYAMIAFVTNLAAPTSNIWKQQDMLDGSNALGMLGNMMNFLAYLFMGIPAGQMLTRIGYKKTTLVGIAVGFFGVLIQYLSGFPEGWAGFITYLVGAFISGFSVCMLNTVVNPMLNLLGGGGNRGNQLNLLGGTFNSLAGTISPMLVGVLVGEISQSTTIGDIKLVMFIAMGVFAVAFAILFFLPIENPENGNSDENTVFERSVWSFRHCTLGVVGIFLYVGVEIGIPGTLNNYLADTTSKGAWGDNVPQASAAIGGFVAGTYWLLMLVGRLVSSAIAGKVSSKMLMIATSSIALLLIIAAMLAPKESMTSMPLFNGQSLVMTSVPVSALLLVLCGLCTSVMWASIFNLATEGLGKYTAKASGLFMTMVVGGGLLPLIQNGIADKVGYMVSYIVPILALAYLLWYALIGSKNVNTDIKVD
ncbi:MAG: MFS transporter [Bacteroidales bacterium]|nr:MFS transporter [Bacteroidales bacterium]